MIKRTCCIVQYKRTNDVECVCICAHTDREIENSRVLASSKFAISCLLKMSFSLCFNGYTNYIAINKSTWKFNSFSFANWFALSVITSTLCSAEVKGFTGFSFWKKKNPPFMWNTVNEIWQLDTASISYCCMVWRKWIQNEINDDLRIVIRNSNMQYELYYKREWAIA